MDAAAPNHHLHGSAIRAGGRRVTGPLAFRLSGWPAVWLLGAAAIRAEEPGWLVRHWQTEDGLPASHITGITQSADGFLWVGTPKGLARFDGLEFKVFDPDLVPAMSSSTPTRPTRSTPTATCAARGRPPQPPARLM